MTPKTLTPKNTAAAALGRLGGRAGTKAQNKARRANAQRAGRPSRVCVHCGEPVAGGHVDRDLDETCGAHGWRWRKRLEEAATVRPDPTLLKDVLFVLDGIGSPRLLARVRAAIDAGR